MRRAAGSLEPRPLADAISRRYGKDRTFSVPILTVLALAGLLDRDAHGGGAVTSGADGAGRGPNTNRPQDTGDGAQGALAGAATSRSRGKPVPDAGDGAHAGPTSPIAPADARRRSARTPEAIGNGWRHVPQLPFELAAVPPVWYRWLRLPVVSYALPALIAIGQVRHRQRPTRNPVTRLVRRLARARTLRRLDAIQPRGGGFLEATPLTGFVVMSLVAAGEATHPVVERGGAFLRRSARADGSWPIDTNLATWVTTLSVNALVRRSDWLDWLRPADRAALRRWLLDQQYRERHVYTDADPGGWAWTDLPGGVPDADDTPGALLALHAVAVEPAGGPAHRDGDRGQRPRGGAAGPGTSVTSTRRGADAAHGQTPAGGDDADRTVDGALDSAVRASVGWLLDLQNADGGMPTFCRGWGALPFDRSSPDLTAHTLRAWTAWRPALPNRLRLRTERATRRAVRYLVRAQQPDGSWIPLWFGNQEAPDEANPVYGTARVLEGLAVLPDDEAAAAEQRAARWLVEAQATDGGWGAAPGVPSSIEETALAVAALGTLRRLPRAASVTGLDDAVTGGVRWLIETTDGGRRMNPTPIGLYFAKLWYSEALYPRIFTLAAFGSIVPHTDR